MAPAAVPCAWQSDALPTELAGRRVMEIHECTSAKRKEGGDWVQWRTLHNFVVSNYQLTEYYTKKLENFRHCVVF